MSVLLETSAGSIVVDLFVDKCPTASLNFLKLCKAKYYNNCLLYDVQPEWIQSGDPTGTGSGGASIFALCAEPSQREERRWFSDEIRPDLKLNQRGLLCMSSNGLNQNGSRFFISLNGESVSHLNGKKTVFGQVAEDEENTLDKIASANVDDRGRPFRDIRILHTFILVDPFPDPEGFMKHPESPKRTRPEQETVEERIGFDQAIELPPGLSKEEVAKRSRESEMKARAVALEMMGDLPDADAAPPENVLFVCKLNAITQDDDLEIIFSRFGDIKSCEVIRDKDTGQSLQYAFVEFATKEQCQEAFFKMNNVLIDDRRIKVDFSQSVAKTWNRFRRQGARQSASSQTEGVKVGAARSFNDARNRKDYEHRGPGDRSKLRQSMHQRDGPGHSKDIRPRDRDRARDQRDDHRRDRSSRSYDRDTHKLERSSPRENRRHDRGNSRERDHRRHDRGSSREREYRRHDRGSSRERDHRRHDRGSSRERDYSGHRESENSRRQREHRPHRDSSHKTSSSKRDPGQNGRNADYRSDSSLSSAQSHGSRNRSTKKHHKKHHKHRKHHKHHKSSKSSKSSRSHDDDRDRKRSRRD